MFGKSKADAAKKHRDTESAREVQRCTNAYSATPAAPDAIFIDQCRPFDRWIVGHGAVTIFGHLEGELQASTVMIAEGHQ